jgi:hypothetical protein
LDDIKRLDLSIPPNQAMSDLLLTNHGTVYLLGRSNRNSPGRIMKIGHNFPHASPLKYPKLFNRKKAPTTISQMPG